MFNQTRMNGTTAQEPPTAVTYNASGLIYDLISLVELQAKLLLTDAREASGMAAGSIVGMCIMTALALASAVVGLIGVAEVIVAAGLSSPVSYMLTALLGILMAAAIGWFSYRKLRAVSKTFERSSQELYDNLEFVKSLVRTEEEGFAQNSFLNRQSLNGR